jgi:hypothetical protein
MYGGARTGGAVPTRPESGAAQVYVHAHAHVHAHGQAYVDADFGAQVDAQVRVTLGVAVRAGRDRAAEVR